jgi:hypothetical protein
MLKICKFISVICFLLPVACFAQFFEEGHLIVDVRNNVVWLRCSVGQRWDHDTGRCTGKVVKLNQSQIKKAILQADQQLGGHWRLPTRGELETLVCETCGPPMIREKYFPDIESEAYWTRSKNNFHSKMYWSVNFMTGHSYSRFFGYQQLPFLIVKDR